MCIDKWIANMEYLDSKKYIQTAGLCLSGITFAHG